MSRFAAVYPDSWEDLVDDWLTDLEQMGRRWQEPPEEVRDADDED